MGMFDYSRFVLQMPSQMIQAAPLIIIAVMPGGVFIFPTILPVV
jgi:hypothetical protein